MEITGLLLMHYTHAHTAELCASFPVHSDSICILKDV